ncbi:putative permease [Caldalkalibacillus uzonensis]|uniref:Permease n=1 Tax=Caldalkalibacillus uzonensis TaxID=353224 RepID=A0ABU0CVC2_9BACI|nr:AEC family transporter [Caldalkalibacillus uzonensis]MDQ0340356.1 putative permease [Caldalkalibacillus uzonensis]
MSPFHHLFEELIVLYIMALIGFLAKKKGIWDVSADNVLTRLLLYITLPALILYSMDIPFSRHLLAHAGWLCLLSAFALITACLVSRQLSTCLPLSSSREGVWQGLVTFGNQGFLGYSVCFLLFGEQGIVYAAIFNIPYLFFIWTYGIFIVARHSTMLNWSQLLLNPGVLATALGFMFYLTPFHWPSTLSSVLESVGLMTIPLSMIMIGSFMANMNKRDMGRLSLNRSLWIACALKLVLLPLLLLPFSFLPVPFILVTIAFMITAMPAAPTICLYAQQYGKDATFAAAGVTLSTLLALITVPLLYMLAQWAGQMWFS